MTSRARKQPVRGAPGVWLLLILALASGCRTIRPPNSGEAALVDRARRLQPSRWEADQTMVFEFKRHWWEPSIRMTALGYAASDSTTGDYHLVCLSPLGLRMFEVSRVDGREQAFLPLPELQKNRFLVDSILRDTDRLINAGLPSRFVVTASSPDRVVIEYSDGGSNKTVCAISAPDALVATRSFYEGYRPAVSMEYSDYRSAGGGVVPFRVKLINRLYGYRLNLTIREFRLGR